MLFYFIYSRDITIKGPESKQQRSTHKSPNGDSGDFDHPPTPTQTTPKAFCQTSNSENTTPNTISATTTTTTTTTTTAMMNTVESNQPPPSSSPRGPIQKLSLFTGEDFQKSETALTNTNGNESRGDYQRKGLTSDGIDRLVPIGPNSMIQSSQQYSNLSINTNIESKDNNHNNVNHDNNNSSIVDQNEDGFTLGMEYDVVTTQYERKSSYQPNVHIELMNLSNSVLPGGSQSIVGSMAYSSTKKWAGSVAAQTVIDGNHALEGELTDKAVKVVHRVMDKLIGLDFENKVALDISEQIDRLIRQATSNENLSTCFSGWCAFW